MKSCREPDLIFCLLSLSPANFKPATRKDAVLPQLQDAVPQQGHKEGLSPLI